MSLFVYPVTSAPSLGLSSKGPPFEVIQPKPVLKWAGGKRDQVGTILPLIDDMTLGEKIHTYFEPFVGAGSIFFALANAQRFERAILSDTNAELIGMYTSLRDEVQLVLMELRKLTKKPPSKAFFLEVRGSRPRGTAKRAARMIYLNKTCFNGLYRVNSRGEFNVPYGNPKKNVKIYDEENLRAVSHVLRGVRLEVRSYQDSLSLMAQSPWDFVYLDPPYVPISKTSNFRAYQKAGFSAKDQEELAERFRAYAERGGLGLLSNSHCPTTLKLYQGLVRHRVLAKRSISAKGSVRGVVSELLVESRFRK